MPDTRPLDSFNFGYEWEPKLAEVMLSYPWPDSAFSMADPALVCSICGRAAASINHKGAGRHDFVPTEFWTEDQISQSRDEWRRRMAGLPTKEALDAWKSIHFDNLARLHSLFAFCAAKTRDDIEMLGCTGCASYGAPIDSIKFMRIGLAGSGVGLPCYVPPDRYCLAHEVSGGLQEGQVPAHLSHVEKVSRPLTPQEASHDKLVSAARKSDREHGAHSLLHGHTLPKGWEETMDGQDTAEKLQDTIVAAGRARTTPDPLFAWVCDEHEETNWACRYCAAQAIIEGELMPMYVLDVDNPNGEDSSGYTEAFSGSDAAKEIVDEDASNSNSVKLYVRVATFTRKLSRE